MPVTVQTASPVDRLFKNRTVAGIRSTARSTQTTREQTVLQSVDRTVDRKNVHTDTCTARATVDSHGRPAKPDIDSVDCPVDRIRSKISFQTEF